MLAIIPVAIMLAAAGGVAICKLLSVDPHLREMLFAGGVCLIASELGAAPVILTRGAEQLAVARAGLVGTMIHLFSCAALGGGLMMISSMRLSVAVIYWLLALYWLTLMLLAICFVRALRASPPVTASSSIVPGPRRA